MAQIFSNGANLSGLHYRVSNVPSIASSGFKTVSTTEIFSATFTAPNTINYSVGGCFYIELSPYSTNPWPNIFLKLQEFNGSVWVDKASGNIDFDQQLDTREQPNRIDMGWIYVPWYTPYQYATTTAGYYRLSIYHETGAASAYRVASNSGDTNFAFMVVDDRTTTLSANDSLWIISSLNIDASITLGGGVTTYTKRTLDNPINILTGGKISGVTGNNTLTLRGNFVIGQYGSFGNGVEITTANSVNFLFDFTGVTTNNIGILFDYYSKKNIHGGIKNTNLLYTSGDGSTGSPLTVLSDWNVGDKIYIQASGAKGRQEKRFIKTKPSPTTATLSATLGGVETPFTYAHSTSCIMINLTRNVKFATNDAAKGFRITDISSCYRYNAGARDIAYVEFDTPADAYITHTTLSYCSLHDGNDPDYLINFRGFRALTHVGNCFVTNLFLFNVDTNDLLVVFSSSSLSQKLQDCFLFDAKEGILYLDGIGHELNNCRLGDNSRGTICKPGQRMNACSIINCRFDGGADASFIFADPFGSFAIINCVSGGILDNTYFIKNFTLSGVPPDYKILLIQNTLVLDSNYWENSTDNQDIAVGGEINIQKYQQLDYKHFTYKANGIEQSTGVGLDDTTVRAATGHRGWRFAPNDSDVGISEEFVIPAPANKTVYWFGYIRVSTPFLTDPTASVKVELFLPGSVAADSTANFVASAANIANGEICSVIAQYTGSISSTARVKITVKGIASAAYVYLFDPYDGKNDLTNFNIWIGGKPNLFLFQDFQEPASVWSVPVFGNTSVGSFGEQIQDLVEANNEALGLMQSNFRLTVLTRDTNGNLLTGRIRIYSSAADANNDINVLHEYDITATIGGDGLMESYLSVKGF